MTPAETERVETAMKELVRKRGWVWMYHMAKAYNRLRQQNKAMMMVRRMILGAGAALLIGGWGATGCAKQQQQIGSTANWERLPLWTGAALTSAGSKTIYTYGVFGMAVGAGLLGSALLRASCGLGQDNDPHEEQQP